LFGFNLYPVEPDPNYEWGPNIGNQACRMLQVNNHYEIRLKILNTDLGDPGDYEGEYDRGEISLVPGIRTIPIDGRPPFWAPMSNMELGDYVKQRLLVFKKNLTIEGTEGTYLTSYSLAQWYYVRIIRNDNHFSYYLSTTPIGENDGTNYINDATDYLTIQSLGGTIYFDEVEVRHIDGIPEDKLGELF
ncbi:MAG: hypothetical protein AB1478_09170, partial [Nitrospirota bacterium]